VELRGCFRTVVRSFNQLAVPVLLIATVDFGPECVVNASEHLRSIKPVERPPACEKSSGRLIASIKHADGRENREEIPLSLFSVGFGGKVFVPLFFYRKLSCLDAEVRLWTSGQSKPLRKVIRSKCGE